MGQNYKNKNSDIDFGSYNSYSPFSMLYNLFECSC